MPNLSEITAKLVYLDANAFHYLFREHRQYSKNVREFFHRVREGEVEAITSPLSIEELLYKLLLHSVAEKYACNPVEKLREDKKVLQEFVDKLERAVHIILAIDNLRMVDITSGILPLVPEDMRRYLLLPRDSLHLEIMLSNGCRDIVSQDEDFDGVPEITRWDPRF
jgi:predicted nucleic acid-binding protein